MANDILNGRSNLVSKHNSIVQKNALKLLSMLLPVSEAAEVMKLFASFAYSQVIFFINSFGEYFGVFYFFFRMQEFDQLQ